MKEPSSEAARETPDERASSARSEPDDGVDATLIRWMLSLTPAERLDVLQAGVRSLAELRDAASRARNP